MFKKKYKTDFKRIMLFREKNLALLLANLRTCAVKIGFAKTAKCRLCMFFSVTSSRRGPCVGVKWKYDAIASTIPIIRWEHCATFY